MTETKAMQKHKHMKQGTTMQGKNIGKRSGFRVMAELIGLVKPLSGYMCLAVFAGLLGHLCAAFITILGGYAVLAVLGLQEQITPMQVFVAVPLLALLRAGLRYGEQSCNHFIAFKLLAIIRHKVFAVLRKLCPAKLEGRDRGDLISLITADIEALEVFYAHTISPIAIAILTSGIMVAFLGSYHYLAGLLALTAYLTVGVLIPMRNGKRGGQQGMAFRTAFGDLNSFTLDSLRGLDETIQYGQGQTREAEMTRRSQDLGKQQETLSRLEGTQRACTNLAILLASVLGLVVILRKKI
mgnify:CR=1 FL=1